MSCAGSLAFRWNRWSRPGRESPSRAASEPFAELNIWYHTLNCGFRTTFTGETDFPCISDERVGRGRSYVKLASVPRGDAGYDAWVQAMRESSTYAGDGRSHIFDFAEAGEGGDAQHARLSCSRRPRCGYRQRSQHGWNGGHGSHGEDTESFAV